MLDKLNSLHPYRNQPDSALLSDPSSSSFYASIAPHVNDGHEAFSMVRKARSMFAPGADGLRYEPWRLWSANILHQLKICNLLGRLLSFIANGTIPPEVALYFAGSELIPLMSNKIRPIVLDYSLRALASKHIHQSADIKFVNNLMAPIQKGSTIKNGVDKIIHTVKCGRDLFPRKLLLMTGFQNAFNSLDRNYSLHVLSRVNILGEKRRNFGAHSTSARFSAGRCPGNSCF